MKDLYDEFLFEQGKLTRLVTSAIENDQSIALDDTIIAQSHKVDLIIEKLVKRYKVENSKNNHFNQGR